MFYEFRQNNSGGSFDCDENVCKHVFVEETEDEYGNRSMNVLTAKNDSGASFEQIAYLIESMPEELFNE